MAYTRCPCRTGQSLNVRRLHLHFPLKSDADTGICFSPGTNTNKNNDDVQCVMTGM